MGTREPYSLLLFSIITMFILGIIDDLINIQPSLKLFIQFLLALILVWKADIYIYSFNGLFDLYNLPIWISYIFSILVLVFIINAYNIIDGELLWEKEIAETGQIDELAYSISYTNSGNYFICTMKNSLTDPNLYHPKIIKIDSEGNIDWHRSFLANGNESLHLPNS